MPVAFLSQAFRHFLTLLRETCQHSKGLFQKATLNSDLTTNSSMQMLLFLNIFCS